MKSYVQSNLINDEQIEYVAQISKWSLVPKIILGAIFLLLGLNFKGFILIALLLWLSAYLDFITTELAITNKRVVAKFGFISRKTIEMNIPKIESLQVNQGIFGRIFNFGSVIVSGVGQNNAPIPGISKPLEFKKKYFEVQEKN